ncbi:helicase HerA-like domain-containing protein [Microbacterium rhizosphaerae]|uniref:Helicase HerA-like domain-containing protein n=1 Tax=Microbacterium rhizosphaerae TaxID=1678237 RepID=A0ABZ0SJK2_9MICO|nr:helicase HerA-like domain-containing protein [Microbacterium rhizosphaerae]WPR89005.1 helicase HerA-like domain-containing protein [Microbacterium rhizosphaerae]
MTDADVTAAEAELARLRAEAEAAEAQLKAAQAKAALAAAEAEAAKARAESAAPAAPAPAPDPSPAPVADPSPSPVAEPAPVAEPVEARQTSASSGDPSTGSGTGGTGSGTGGTGSGTGGTGSGTGGAGPLDPSQVAAVAAGYAFEGTTLDLGALVNAAPVPSAQIRIPIAMLNRHGLVAGATGTGKTRTLQGLAEQLASKGVPVFAADIKGDLSGVATAGEPNEKLLARTSAIGQDWQPEASVTEYYALGGVGKGVPVRATVTGFGPLLLSKVLGLNATQESSLGLVFHFADQHGLALVDLSDLRAVLTYLTSDEGKGELKDLGGLSAATAGVILRELISFADGGADVFFGEPEFDVKDILRIAPDGRGIISLLEVPGVADKPALFSTFLMYLLAELFEVLPEVGDADKPKLVFFFDEAHLLFRDASKDFVAAITQTVRLIRSKGVGVFFVTQTPKDVPSDILGQLGSRVQHALRAFTPDDAKALRATVGTYPKSGYDLERVLQELGTGEAIVTVMGEKGAPTPVAWTRLRAPQGLMSPTPDAQIDAAVAASPLMPKYGTAVDPESAREILAARLEAATQAAAAEQAAAEKAKADAAAAKAQAAAEKDAMKKAAAEEKARQAEYDRILRQTGGTGRTTRTARSTQKSPMEQILNSKSTQTIITGVIRGLFGTGRR